MNKNKMLRIFFLAVGFMLTIVSPAHAFWNVSVGYGGGYHGYGYGGYGGRGCCNYGPPGYDNYGWGGPNVVVAVPVMPPPPPPAYVFECETLEICDNYTDECWLERRCN